MYYDLYQPIGQPTFYQQWICYVYPMLCRVPKYPTHHTGFLPVDNECQFTRDCDKIGLMVADAGIACKMGKCAIVPFCVFGNCMGNQCKKYTDCSCRNSPDKCFCKDGYCDTSTWECHTSTDCKRLAKCHGKNCHCHDNLCNWDCDTTADCKNQHCNKALGYRCKCENNQCAYKEKPVECHRPGMDTTNIQPCVTKGLCSPYKPCTCTGEGYCNKPPNVHKNGNCGNDEHCKQYIWACRTRRCKCTGVTGPIYQHNGKCQFSDGGSPRLPLPWEI